MFRCQSREYLQAELRNYDSNQKLRSAITRPNSDHHRKRKHDDMRRHTYMLDNQFCMCFIHMPVWSIDIFGHPYLESFTYKAGQVKKIMLARRLLFGQYKKEQRMICWWMFMREDKGSSQKSKGSMWLIVKQASVHTDQPNQKIESAIFADEDYIRYSLIWPIADCRLLFQDVILDRIKMNIGGKKARRG